MSEPTGLPSGLYVIFNEETSTTTPPVVQGAVCAEQVGAPLVLVQTPEYANKHHVWIVSSLPGNDIYTIINDHSVGMVAFTYLEKAGEQVFAGKLNYIVTPNMVTKWKVTPVPDAEPGVHYIAAAQDENLVWSRAGADINGGVKLALKDKKYSSKQVWKLVHFPPDITST